MKSKNIDLLFSCMDILSIDLETYCDLDIKKVGGYKYAENCEILLFAYAFNDEPVQIIDMAQGKEVPLDVIAALTDNTILKTAYNAQFERTVLSNWLYGDGRTWLDASQWFCTMIQGFTLGLPGGLDLLGKVIGLAEDKQKMSVGKRLIQYFCRPCKPTRINGGRTRNLPEHDIEKWNTFKDYCIRDVEAERAIRKKIEFAFPIDRERKLWSLDQKINDRGVHIDRDFVKNAIGIDHELKEEAMKKARGLTGLENPNSREQVLDWIGHMEGKRPDTFDRKARQELAGSVKSDKVRKLIELKELLSKTSVKKYEAMQNAECKDGRVHGMLQFYGAARTGRWAGRLIQLHNLPQNHLNHIEMARELVKKHDMAALSLIYSNPSDILSQLIRTAFIAKNGRFIVADFSAIEARVIAWIADEKWRMKAFADGKDIYCESASQMFHVPVVKHGINGELRAKGKIAELACGYGGGVNALKAFGADKMGMAEDEMNATIKKWRKSSPKVVALWGDVERAAKQAIRSKQAIKFAHDMAFQYEKGLLFIQLPSGRKIAYAKPRIEMEAEFGRVTLTYEGTTMAGNWGRNYTWGGKLVENIVQATARDCLAEAMLRLDKEGYKIVMHVHDEVILEMPYGQGSLNEASEIMGQAIDWAPGLLLRADGYETEFYKKD